MRLMSAYELERRSEKELAGLFYQVSQGLVCTERGTPERRNALGSLENIARAKASRFRK